MFQSLLRTDAATRGVRFLPGSRHLRLEMLERRDLLAADPLLQFVLSARDENDALIENLQGVSEVSINDTESIDYRVNVGEEFNLRVAAQTLQSDSTFGIDQMFTDLLIDQKGVLAPVVGEVQRISFPVENLFAPSGQVTFYFDDNPLQTESMLAEDFLGDTNSELYSNLANVIVSLSDQIDSVDQLEINASSSSSGDMVEIEIEYPNHLIVGSDVPQLNVEWIDSGEVIETRSEQIDIFDDDGNFNVYPIIVAMRNATLLDGVFGTVSLAEFSTDNLQTDSFLSASAHPIPLGGRLPGSLYFNIPVVAMRPAEDVLVSLGIPQDSSVVTTLSDLSSPDGNLELSPEEIAFAESSRFRLTVLGGDDNVPQPLEVTLPDATASDVVVRRNGEHLEVFDRVSQTLLVDRSMSGVQTFTLLGAENVDDRIELDYQSGGPVQLGDDENPTSETAIRMLGRGGNDVVVMVLDPSSSVTVSAGSSSSDALVGGASSGQINVRVSTDEQVIDHELLGFQSLIFESSEGVVVDPRGEWKYESTERENETLTQVFENGVTQLRFRRTGWTNVVNAFDVTGSENVQSLDALRIINELNDRVHSDPVTGVLRDPILVDPYPRNFYDVNRDGKATALDALRVINYLNLIDADAVSEPLETDLRKPSHSELDASDFVFASMDWLQEGWRKGDVWSNDAVIDDSSKRLF
ncbi:MAG TPA: hypothetical protein DDX19_16345 [Rhodopirellula baltica]|nr:dockerin type I domain-containing protein [Rhodopirellula baltica]HBE64271.1 hypothetical protein [Rhodopirellula baltica]